MFFKNSISIYISLITCALLLLGLYPYQQRQQPTEKDVKKQADVKVGMTNDMKFTPDTVRIEVGETVEWKNSSLLAHSVTADPSKSTIQGSAQLPDGAKPFDSGMMDPEQSYSHTFNTAGTFKYFCIPHEGAKMYGWVLVEE